MQIIKHILSIALTCMMLLAINGCVGGAANIPSVVKKVTMESKYLQKEMNLNVYLPKGYSSRTKYPVLYMIHGYGQNEDAWMVNLELGKAADRLIDSGRIEPLIIVAPQVDNGWGVNSSEFPAVLGTPPHNSLNKGRYRDYLTREVVPYIDIHFSTDASREKRYIGGLSMGGYIALYTAFTHVDMFSRVGGHSPGILLEGTPEVAVVRNMIYPNESVRRDRDPLLIARDKDLTALKVYLDCGDKDQYGFYDGSEMLFRILKEKKVAVEYHFMPGEHKDAYWKANTEDYLLFYSGK